MLSASFRKLGDYFTTGRYPLEVVDFEYQQLDQVLVLNEYKSWWDWRAFTVAMLGILQMAAGVAINVLSGGTLTAIGTGLLAEGVSDIMFAIQSGISGTFTWSGYGKQKFWSAGITILTCGFATYLTWSAAAARTLEKGYQIRNILKKVASKIFKAVTSALIAMGVEKLLAFIKKLILDHVGKYIRESVIGAAAFGAIDRMMDAMSKIWRVTGGDMDKSRELIQTAHKESTSSSYHATWLDTLSGRSTQLGQAVVTTFSKCSTELTKREQSLKSISNKQLNDGKSTGNDTIDLAIKAAGMLQTATKVAQTTATAMKWINTLKTGVEIVRVVSHAPEYINHVGHQLEHLAHATDMQLNPDDEKSTVHESEEFLKFKSEMRERVEKETLDHIMTKVNSTWLQPLLQRKIESFIKTAGKLALRYLLGDNDLQGLDAERRQRIKEFEDRAQSVGNNQYNYVDYAEQVASIGQGQPAGLLELQQLSDALGVNIELDDDSGTFTSNTDKKNSFAFKPNGKSSTKTIKLKVEKNDDGTLHASYVDEQGNVHSVTTTSGPNNCVYDAIAKATNKSTDQLINQVQSHAINNERAKYV